MMGDNFTGMNDKNAISSGANNNIANLGLYYMAALDVFHAIKTPGFEDFTVGVSLFEIYGGKLFDLLNDRASVKCLEDSKGKVRFPGLGEHRVSTPDDLIALIEQGASNRSTGTTSRNADSSRSHAVLQLHLHHPGAGARSTTGLPPHHHQQQQEFSRLTFIDLAGSERGADTNTASRATRLEGAEINTSLLALKEVIRALATGDSLSHVPFRGSKLTQVLKESFVGKNGRSVMIACISPNIGNCEQTLNTLRYADRVKERNPETGELGVSSSSSGMSSINHRSGSSKSRTPPRSRVPQSLSETESLVQGMTESNSINDAESSNHSYSNNSDVLDELLATPLGGSDESDTAAAAAAPNGFFTAEEEAPDHQEEIIVQELIATHKDAMTVMLEMVKEEMVLVNQADSDREGLDEYMSKIHTLQDEQLAMITLLREQLLQYRLAQASVGVAQSSPQRDMRAIIMANSTEEGDDSFEDLRD